MYNGRQGKREEKLTFFRRYISKTNEQFLLSKISIHFCMPEGAHYVENHVELKVKANLLPSYLSVIHYLLLLSQSHWCFQRGKQKEKRNGSKKRFYKVP